MNVKHTPGPWSRDTYGIWIGSNGTEVMLRRPAHLSVGRTKDMERAEANTLLALSAPDLLAALEEAADYIGAESAGSAEFWRKYRAAIAKMKGE